MILMHTMKDANLGTDQRRLINSLLMLLASHCLAIVGSHSVAFIFIEHFPLFTRLDYNPRFITKSYTFILDTSHHADLFSFILTESLSSSRLIVVLINQVHVFSFPNNPQKLFTFHTRDNPKGVVFVFSNMGDS